MKPASPRAGHRPYQEGIRELLHEIEQLPRKQRYTGQKIFEAGIKENKQVFYLHRTKVRSKPGATGRKRLECAQASWASSGRCA